MNSRLIMFLISIFSLIFIVNISRSIYTLWKRGAVVTEREAVQQKLAQENATLKQKAQEVESADYIEKVAREKLNLQKEGEVVVVLPKEVTAAGVSEVQITAEANWYKWWKLFF